MVEAADAGGEPVADERAARAVEGAREERVLAVDDGQRALRPAQLVADEVVVVGEREHRHGRAVEDHHRDPLAAEALGEAQEGGDHLGIDVDHRAGDVEAQDDVAVVLLVHERDPLDGRAAPRTAATARSATRATPPATIHRCRRTALRYSGRALGVGDGHRRRFAATTQDQPDDERDGDDRAQRGQDQPRLAQLTAEQRSEERLDAAQVHWATT